MGKLPVSIGGVDCGNGKRKLVVREREYDARSWQGLKTLAAVAFAVVMLVGTVLFTYFTAEAAQTDVISTQAQELATQKQRQGSEQDLQAVQRDAEGAAEDP